MAANFDAFTAAKEFARAGFSGTQVDALVDNIAKSRNDMATKKDVARCWQLILGVVVPLLLLNIAILAAK